MTNRLQNAALDDVDDVQDDGIATTAALDIETADFDAECASGVIRVASRLEPDETSWDDEDSFDVEAFVAMTGSEPPPAA